MDAGNWIDIGSIAVAVGSAIVAGYYANKANGYSSTSASEAQKATEAANKANIIADDANKLMKSANDTANKALALESASKFFDPIDTCTRLLNSMIQRPTAHQLTEADCINNLQTITRLKAELKVLEGAAYNDLVPATSISILNDFASELARFNEFVHDAGFDLVNVYETLLQNVNHGHNSAITAMTDHLPLLRAAFADPEVESNWSLVIHDQNDLRLSLEEFKRDIEQLLR